MAESKSTKSKDVVVRIDSLRGKTFSLPHAGNPGEGLPFEVGDDGIVSVRGGGKLNEEQAETIVRLKHLDGAVRVE